MISTWCLSALGLEYFDEFLLPISDV